jgi:hypothetical protein
MRFYSIVASIGFAILVVLPAGCNRSHRTEDEDKVPQTRIAPEVENNPKMEAVLKQGGGYQGPKKHRQHNTTAPKE